MSQGPGSPASSPLRILDESGRPSLGDATGSGLCVPQQAIDGVGQGYRGPMWDDDEDLALRELSSARDTDELCRLLLQSSWGWRSSSHHVEAVDLLGKVQGTWTLPTAFCALLLCTCQRWQAVTAKLIAAIEASGMLTSSDLDELAESFLNEDVMVRYSLAWLNPEWLNPEWLNPEWLNPEWLNPEWLNPEWLKDLANETGMASVAEDATGSDRRRIQPPLHRWAASRTLRKEPQRLDGLLATASALPPHDRDALVLGLLDAAGSLKEAPRRGLVRRGLGSGQARVRRAALRWLSELDGLEAARRRARSDPDATVRKWEPAPSPPPD